MSSSDLDHVSANGKRKYCDEQGCSEETDHLSLIKCFRHSGLFHKDQQCDFAECDNWIASRGRCEAHGGVVKHCKHGVLKEECRACHYGGSGFCKKHGRIKGTCRECDAATIAGCVRVSCSVGRL